MDSATVMDFKSAPNFGRKLELRAEVITQTVDVNVWKEGKSQKHKRKDVTETPGIFAKRHTQCPFQKWVWTKKKTKLPSMS
jgi:hypothetical protein